MESGSSFMKNLWNPVRLLENGPVFLKIFLKIVRLFEKILLFSIITVRRKQNEMHYSMSWCPRRDDILSWIRELQPCFVGLVWRMH